MGRLPCWLPRGQQVLYSSCKVMTYTSQEWSIHPGFQTRSRHNQRCKTVTPQKDLDLWHPKMYLKETSTSSLWNSRKGGVQETLNLQKNPALGHLFLWPDVEWDHGHLGPVGFSTDQQDLFSNQPAEQNELFLISFFPIDKLRWIPWRVLQRSKQMETNWLMLVLWVCCQKVSFPGFWKLLKN